MTISHSGDQRMREPHFVLSAPTAWPRGKECVLDYDGYVLNDLRRMDRIVVESIDGLTGPDLAAEAEKNPDGDGEFPLDVTYGGRTLTLRVSVESGTLDTMRALYSYVLDAFDGGSNPSIERLLWFRWLDWRDFFVDTNALVDYLYDAGSGTLAVSSDGSGLAPSSTADKAIVLRPRTNDGSVISRYTYGDGEVIVRFRSSLTGLVVGPELRRSSSSQKLRLVYDDDLEEFVLYKVVAGVASPINTTSTTGLSADASYWIRVRAKGDLISYSMWDAYPPDVGGTPISEDSYVLDAGELAQYPAAATGLDWGLFWTPAATTDRIEMIDVGAVDKGDAVVWCRKAVQAEGPEIQEDDKFQRKLVVALRASDARFVSRKPTVVVAHPQEFALTFPADGSGLTFPADGSGLVFGGYLSETVVNLGRSPASPVIRYHGPMTNTVLYNPLDDRRAGVTGSIESGDYIELDCARHTASYSSGADAYRRTSDDTNWLSLVSGDNDIVLGADRIFDSSVTPPTATVVAATDVFTLASHGLVDDQAIVVSVISGALPLVDDTLVYVRDRTAGTFKVATTLGGPALNVAIDGSVGVYGDVGYVEFIYRHSSR